MSPAPVPAVVLAGGRSSRMGRPKALLPAGRETFVGRIARTLRDGGAGPVVVVAPAGDLAARIAAALGPHRPPPRVVANPDPDRGQLSSLLVGLAAIDRLGEDPRGAEAALVTLVDVPLVTAATVRALLDRWRRTRAPVVRPARVAPPRPRPPRRLRPRPVRRAPPRRPRPRRQAGRPRPRGRGGGRRRRRRGRLHRHRHPGGLPPRVRGRAAAGALIPGPALTYNDSRVGQWRSWERA